MALPFFKKNSNYVLFIIAVTEITDNILSDICTSIILLDYCGKKILILSWLNKSFNTFLKCSRAFIFVLHSLSFILCPSFFVIQFLLDAKKRDRNYQCDVILLSDQILIQFLQFHFVVVNYSKGLNREMST
jgi:hypothetical protein